MKIIYAGTPEFAVPALAAIISAGHDIKLVLTQPDRPSGRGMKLKQSPVKTLALQHGIEVFQPETLKDAEVQKRIINTQADVMLVAAYGLIIPTLLLQSPNLGCYNIHASLLPRWRGAAPIQRAILAGDKETGITIMEVVPALDAGAMVIKEALPISEQDTAQTLHDQLAEIGARLMIQVINTLERDGKVQATAQQESLVTYAHKLEKAEAAMDWTRSANEISRQIRAFNPFPVAQTLLHDETCRIWMAQALLAPAPVGTLPGTIIDTSAGIDVSCGNGVLRITELQMPGGKRMLAKDFLKGHPLQIGEKLNT